MSKYKKKPDISGGVYNEGDNYGIQVGRDFNAGNDNLKKQGFADETTELVFQQLGYSNRELRQILIDHFSISELRDLCFDLNLDYEILPNNSKPDLARELLVYVARHKKSREFVDILQLIRPELFK